MHTLTLGTYAVKQDGSRPAEAAALPSSAFSALVREHGPGLRHFLFRMLRSEEDAEDACSTTFLRAWTARDRFRAACSVKTWLYQIGTRVALDMLRQRRRRARHGTTVSLDSLSNPGCEASLSVVGDEAAVEDRLWVGNAMQALDAEQREFLLLHERDGWTYTELARHYGIGEGAVRSRLRRIREILRAGMALD